MPRVSVVIPSYNHGRFLDQRLESIYSQTYQDFEVIIIDDNSTDNSKEIIAKYRKNKNTKIIYNKENSGSVFSQWQKGIDLSDGQFIWIAESDDYAHPDLLKTLLEVMETHQNVGLAYCQSHLVNTDNRILNIASAWTNDLDTKRWVKNYINSGIDEIDNYLLKKKYHTKCQCCTF